MTKNSGSHSKRRTTDNKQKGSTDSPKEQSENNDDILVEEPNSGFSSWLRTGEGVEYMRTFVIINSLIVFSTMTWPQLQKMFNIIRSYWDEDYEYN